MQNGLFFVAVDFARGSEKPDEFGFGGLRREERSGGEANRLMAELCVPGIAAVGRDQERGILEFLGVVELEEQA